MVTLGSGSSREEIERLAALASYHEAGAEPGTDLDNIVQVASELFDVPIALISLVGADTQTFAARVGLRADSTSRADSFCAHAMQGTDVFVVPDAALDSRFAENPLVTGDPAIRFYAGAPLVSSLGGQGLGALCVIDRSPRTSFGPREQRLLAGLATLVMDRMELRRVEAERRASVARFDRFFAAKANAVICASADGLVTSWNPAAEILFGWRSSEIMGQHTETVLPTRFRATLVTHLAELAVSGGESTAPGMIELSMLRRDGSEFPAEVWLTSWREEHGQIAFGATIHDVSRRKQAEARLSHLATHDALTGLANRSLMTERLQQASTGNEIVALVLLDLDGFKTVNDTLGHQAGDFVLREVAHRLAAALRGRGLLARLGGDEFAVVLLDGTEAVAREVAQDLQAAVADLPFTVQDRIFRCGVSAGIAISRSGETGSLLTHADLALYRVKSGGRGECQVYEPSMGENAKQRRRLNEDVLRAAERGEFLLYYQPQVRLQDRQVIGAEALLRWQHPTRGLLTPATFLATLEGTAKAAAVGDWALDEACRQAARWQEDGRSFRMSVNLFAAQISRDGLDEIVGAALQRHGLGPEVLMLEVTEETVLEHSDNLLGPLWRLHHQGVGIALDDYGTGYASLSTLKRFPLTQLKIDRTFVTEIATDLHDGAIVDSILTLGRKLDLEIIAEGIETEAQEASLCDRGCLFGQGYLFGQPVTPFQFGSPPDA